MTIIGVISLAVFVDIPQPERITPIIAKKAIKRK
jgi:hypothetical protein